MSKKTKGKLDPKLEPEEGTVVPTGEEESAGEKIDPNEARKALFKKARENRELTTRKEAEEMPDAAAMQAAAAEAAEGDERGTSFDTERPDRFAEDTESDDDQYVEVVDHEDEEVVEGKDVIVEEGEEIDQKPVVNLDYEAVDGRVKAVIHGIDYDVPEADVIASGGLEQYQRQRAASIDREQSATEHKALIEERKKLEQQQLTATAKGEPPATGALNDEATLEDQRKKVLEAVLNGTEDDLDSVIDSIRGSGETTEPEDTETGKATDQGTPTLSDSIVDNFETTWRAELQEANAFLMAEYEDVVSDNDLRNIGDRKFKELRADPANLGRKPKDMAREAGEFARSVSRRGSATKETDTTEKLEQRRERKRVLPKSSQAHQTPRALPERVIPSARDHIRNLQRHSGQGATRKQR